MDFTIIQVSFKITGFPQNPDELTSSLKLKPTKTWLKGEKKPGRSTITWPTNGWEISLPSRRDTLISTEIANIMDLIYERRDALRDLKPGCNKYLSCLLEMHGDDRPPVALSASLMGKVVDIGADIDIDLYKF